MFTASIDDGTANQPGPRTESRPAGVSRNHHGAICRQVLDDTRQRNEDGAAIIQAYQFVGVRVLMAGLIGGIFVFQYPMIVVLSLTCCAFLFLMLSVRRSIHPVGWWILANFVLWCASGLISGGIELSSFVTRDFWRGEGRCFFFYLPLLAFSVMRVGRRELRYAVRCVCVLTVLGSGLCFLWLIGCGDLFQTVEDPESGEITASLYFVGLLTSHTGAGAFWGTVAAFLIAYSTHVHHRPIQCLAVAATCMTFATGGRAATLGLLAAIAWMIGRGGLFGRRNLPLLSAVGVLAVAGAALVATCVPQIGERMGELLSQRTVTSIRAAANECVLEDASGFFYSGANLECHNLVIRVYLWKYALHLAKESPLVGVGFCRFNDSYPEFRGVRHVVWMMVEGERNYGSGIQWEREQLMVSTGNAHNSYLHMLAETGFSGLALFLLLWANIFRACQDVAGAKPSCDDSQLIAYTLGCRAMIVCLLVAALAGHALCAPTGGVLATTIVGAGMACWPRRAGMITQPGLKIPRNSGRRI